VLYILITDYRSISERLGLEAVDQITVDLATLLRKLVTEQELVARFSDAVFVVHTPEIARKAVLSLGERLSNGIRDHVSHAAQKLITTTSATGICLIDDAYVNAYQILANADRACDKARRSGTNQVQIYTGPIGNSGVRQREDELVDLIREAISEERLNLRYQPIASFQNNTEERYEVQLQILDPQNEPLAMEIIEPVADRRGLLFPLDKWIIARSMEKLLERYSHGKTPPILFVPISGNSLKDGGLPEWLLQRLKSVGLGGNFLVLEAREALAEQYFKESKTLRERLKRLNCGFALSQLGGKDNSERLLEHLQPDYIKLDGALVRKLSNNRDTASRDAVAALTGKAGEMAVQVIAEGISSAPQMASIWNYGVTLVQGTMVQAPGPEMDFDFRMFVG
jgi:diguanylate cyclase (GGDEF)-like protein